jgi:hypothetical protein
VNGGAPEAAPPASPAPLRASASRDAGDAPSAGGPPASGFAPPALALAAASPA